MSDTSPSPFDPDDPDLRKLIEQLLGSVDHPALADALRQLGIDQLDPAAMGMVAQQLRAFFDSAPAEGINLELSTDVARKTVSAAGDRSVTDAQRRAVHDAVRVAGLWLDAVTEFSAPALTTHAWSRAEWVAQTMPTWGALVAPVADGVNAAVASAMRRQIGALGETDLAAMPWADQGLDVPAMLGQLEPMMARMSSSMFGVQMGQAVGSLASEVLTGAEVGLPIVPGGAVALLPANVEAFAEGLQVDTEQVLLYLAAREAARMRLFAHVPWVGAQLLAAVAAYARDIDIDTEAIEAKLSSLDPTDPQAMQQALSDSLFTPAPSAAQQLALGRLETLLALVEGWVDVVADRTARGHLPQTEALGEAMRRRRAGGGPAEHLFSQLVGLRLRPRRLRDAAALFAALEAAGGPTARDAAWAHPDLAPTAADLDDPLGFVERSRDDQATDVDAALAQLFAAADREAAASDQELQGPTDAGPWPEWPYPPAGRRRPPPPEPGAEPAEEGPGG